MKQGEFLLNLKTHCLLNGGKALWKDDIIASWHLYETKISLKVLNPDLSIISWYENTHDYVGMSPYLVGNGSSCWISVSPKVQSDEWGECSKELTVYCDLYVYNIDSVKE